MASAIGSVVITRDPTRRRETSVAHSVRTTHACLWITSIILGMTSAYHT